MTRWITAIVIQYTDIPEGKYDVREEIFIIDGLSTTYYVYNTVNVTDDYDAAVQQAETLAALYDVPLNNHVTRTYGETL